MEQCNVSLIYCKNKKSIISYVFNRYCNACDIKGMVTLLDELFSQDIEFVPDHDKQQKGIELIFNDPTIGEILVLKYEEKPVGMVSLLYSISTALGGKVAILEDMIIAKEFRSKKLGSQLLQEAITFAKERGCLRITLLTDFDNEIAQRFYRKYGFTKSAMIPMRLCYKF